MSKPARRVRSQFDVTPHCALTEAVASFTARKTGMWRFRARIYRRVRYARVARMARHDRAMRIVRLQFRFAFPL